MRKIVAYKNYYHEFMASLTEQERGKIKRALLLFETEDRVPRHYISYIRDGVYEFRVTYGTRNSVCSSSTMATPLWCCSTAIQKRHRKRLSVK